VEGRELAVVYHFSWADACSVGAAGCAEFAFDALADESGFVGLLRGFFEGYFDVAVGDPAGAKVAGDAEFSLFAGFRAVASELLGVAGVINITSAFEACQDVFDERGVFAAALEGALHFVDGVRAAHEDFDGGIVKSGFGVELAGLGEHEEKMR